LDTFEPKGRSEDIRHMLACPNVPCSVEFLSSSHKRTPKLPSYRLLGRPRRIYFTITFFVWRRWALLSFMGFIRFFLFLLLSLGIDQLFKLVLAPLFLGWSFFIFSFSLELQVTFHEPFDFLRLPSLIILGILILFICFIEYMLFRVFSKYNISSFWSHFFWGILSGGMISNVIDRIIYGSVKNVFLTHGLGSFNFADIFIISAALGLFLFLWKKVPYTNSI